MKVATNYYSTTWREVIPVRCLCNVAHEKFDAIAFMNLDQRLLKYLSDHAKILGSVEINHTHQQVAEDLHSSRVVISRLLKQLETRGEIKLSRNKIILLKF